MGGKRKGCVEGEERGEEGVWVVSVEGGVGGCGGERGVGLSEDAVLIGREREGRGGEFSKATGGKWRRRGRDKLRCLPLRDYKT